jgi:hypothetical protein
MHSVSRARQGSHVTPSGRFRVRRMTSIHKEVPMLETLLVVLLVLWLLGVVTSTTFGGFIHVLLVVALIVLVLRLVSGRRVA